MRHLLLLFATAISIMASAQISILPYVEPFDDTSIPADWTQVDNQGNEQIWEFGTVIWTPNPPALTGNYAVLNSDGYGESGQQDADLISPTFDLSGFSSVNLSFSHYFFYHDPSSAKLSYSIDNGATWTLIKEWATSSANPEIFNQTIPDVAGESEVKFKWNYTGTYGWGWAIDDVTVSEPGLVTWTGMLNSDWHFPFNWSTMEVPGLSDNVIIPQGPVFNPEIMFDEAATVCYNLTIESGASLTINPGIRLTVTNELTNNSSNGLVIKSDETGTGSLIASSQTGSGTAEIQRYMTQNRWYYVAPPVVQSISSFLTNNASIPTNASSRGMMNYDTETNSWNPYFTDLTSGDFEAGSGYGVRTTSNTYVTFNGSLAVGTITTPLITSGNGWNLIGNPYTSAININFDAGAVNFISDNITNFPESYAAIYIWDGTAYQPISQASGAEFSTLGQAFFIKTIGESANFNTAMQIHKPVELLKSGTIRPEIKLSAVSSEKSATTSIKFIKGATAGVDKGYDAGIFKSDNSFSVFTKLVDDNDVEFALQCLPELSSETIVVPVGIDFASGGEITLSAQLLGIPLESSIVLEDRLLNVFTTFNEATNKYKTTLTANSKGTGRFYLHVSGKTQVTGINKSIANKINARVERDEIIINGITESNAVAKLFDLRGRSVLVKKLDRTATNRINVNGIDTGIYMLQVVENGKNTGVKLQITGN